MRKEDDAEPTRCQVVGDVVYSPAANVTPGRDACSGRATAESSARMKEACISDGARRATGRHRSLADGSGVESRNVIIFNGKADLDWFAAYFAVLDVRLSPDGQVQEHRDLFTTIRAVKLVFHSVAGLSFPFFLDCHERGFSGDLSGVSNTGQTRLARFFILARLGIRIRNDASQVRAERRNTTMICSKCGHSSGMHDERGCVALNCSCGRYIPLPTNVIRFVQPARGPLNVRRDNR